MRQLKYISPSSLGKWESDRELFYIENLADTRPSRPPQSRPMSIGSAFDAYVKADLHAACYGAGSDPKYTFEALFETQVDKVNRDWARDAGAYAYECYRITGAYTELLDELTSSSTPPQFEFTAEEIIEGVPLLGKPDCCYTTGDGITVILDWKVNGFCSKSAASPYKGFTLVRDGWTPDVAKASRGHDKPHKLFKEIIHGSLKIASHYLHEACSDWGDQLSIYAWLMGETPGSENIVARIDQLVCKTCDLKYPLIRVANHKCRLSAQWQKLLLTRVQKCWQTITSKHIFTDLSYEENLEKCALLENYAASLYASEDSDSIEDWVLQISKPTRPAYKNEKNSKTSSNA